jgi:hypothetical protein
VYHFLVITRLLRLLLFFTFLKGDLYWNVYGKRGGGDFGNLEVWGKDPSIGSRKNLLELVRICYIFLPFLRSIAVNSLVPADLHLQ